jgi:hypothetical protein
MALALIGCASFRIKVPYKYSGTPNLKITLDVSRGLFTSHSAYIEIFKETKACQQYDTLGMFKLDGLEQTIAIPTTQALLIRISYGESSSYYEVSRRDQILFKPMAGEFYHLVYTDRSGLSGLELFRDKKTQRSVPGMPQDCLFKPKK